MSEIKDATGGLGRLAQVIAAVAMRREREAEAESTRLRLAAVSHRRPGESASAVVEASLLSQCRVRQHT